MFQSPPKKTVGGVKKALKDLTRIVPAQTLLMDAKRQSVLESIRSLSELEDKRYASLCDNLLKTLVNYFQNLPSTSNSFYAQAGGLMDHALFRTEAALQLFSQFTLLDANNQLSEEQKLWQYALLSASLLQGAGKLYTEFHIELFDEQGNYLSIWNPLTANLTAIGSFYDYEFRKDQEQSFRQRITLLMAKAIMPASGFAWIASNAEVLEVWMALLLEDQGQAGTLGAILIRADALAIQHYFNEILMKRLARSRVPGTFHADLPESITDREQKMGFTFILWLNKALGEGHLVLNQAPLFMVPGGMLISPEVYKLFIREHPEFKSWQAVQKGFLSLGLHTVNTDGSSMARFSQTSGAQVHSGDIFSRYALALPESIQVQNMSTGKIALLSAIALVHLSQSNPNFNRIQPLLESQPLAVLTTNGNWTAPQETPVPNARNQAL